MVVPRCKGVTNTHEDSAVNLRFIGRRLVIPLLGVVAYPRFCLILVPSLAVYFADGASWIAERARAWNRFAMPAVTASAVVLAVTGLAWCWWGPLGQRALHFRDGPIVPMRQAGLWLLAHGRPGARVLDRKPYVPYFARMEHVRMPDDDYETLINWARASGVDYVVLEEYITASIRRQFLPLVTDEAFERRERRLRPIYKVRPYNWGGVAIYEVVREPHP